MNWHTREPPVGQDIEYERGDGTIHKGKLRPAGLHIRTPDETIMPELVTEYCSEDETDVFEVRQWRPLPG